MLLAIAEIAQRAVQLAQDCVRVGGGNDAMGLPEPADLGEQALAGILRHLPSVNPVPPQDRPLKAFEPVADPG
jgi:hypothetical protein